MAAVQRVGRGIRRLGVAVLVAAAALTGRAHDPAHAQAAQEFLTPPAALAIEGMPPIPARIATAMAPYGRSRSATFRDWHPTRREMIVITRLGDSDQIYRVAAPGAPLVQLTSVEGGLGGGQRDRYAATWQQATGNAVLYQNDLKGNERYQHYRLDLATGETTMITDGASRNLLGAWSRKGDRLAYTSTRRNDRDFDLYVVDPADKATDRLVAELEGQADAVEWIADDSAVLVEQRLSATLANLWRVDVSTGAKTLLTPAGFEPLRAGGASLARDGRSLFITTSASSDFLRLARLDVATGAVTPITDDAGGDVEEVVLSPDGAVLAFTVNEDGQSRLRLLDAVTGRERPAPSLEPGVITGLSWHRNGVDLAFNYQSPRTPGDVYSVDTTTRAVVRWTVGETGGLDPATLATPEIARWQSFDGLRISGVLYRPPARFTGRRPVMINIHGGPENVQARPTYIGRSNYFLNEMGVAIIYPNFRGSWGFGRRFRDLDNGVLRDHTTRDIGALLDWIKSRPDLDPDRVMITGASFGGYLTLTSFVTYNDRIRCAFAGFPISNIVTQIESLEPSRRDGRRSEYGDERDPAVRDFLLKVAPVTNADRIRKPLFLAHGKNDPRVPVTESEQMAAAVRKNGVPLWFVVADDEGHGFARQANSAFLLHAWAWFMEQYLTN
jgi:dipeptidyl aminopeptidase/acylaminoacyl peptidase